MIEQAPTGAAWIYDGMALVQALPIKLTWKELADTSSRSCNTSRTHASRISENNYGHYGNNQIKQMKQKPRGILGRRIFIPNEGQAMTQNTK